MKWGLSFTRQAKDFIAEQKVSGDVLELIKKSIQKFQGETMSIDIKKMKGEWSGFYRIRKGKWRMIASFDFNTHSIHIEVIDWRGNIY